MATGCEKSSLKSSSSVIEIESKDESINLNESGVLIGQPKKDRVIVIDYELLPDWLQDNEYLKSCHRPPTQSYFECFKSVFYIHTETGNIWTHIIGCLVFVAIAAYFLVTQNGHIKLYDKLVFLSFFTSAILCLGMSSLFHTFCCHSVEVFQFFRKLDYLGIYLLEIGSFIPWVYYGFYCEVWIKVVYIAMISIFGSIIFLQSWFRCFMDHRYKHVRAMVFISAGLSVIVPVAHCAFTRGLQKSFVEDRLDLLMIMAFLYILGAVIYASQVPEKYFPGKCDLHSHQFLHILVVFAAITHYIGIYEMATNRLQNRDLCLNNTGNFYVFS